MATPTTSNNFSSMAPKPFARKAGWVVGGMAILGFGLWYMTKPKKKANALQDLEESGNQASNQLPPPTATGSGTQTSQYRPDNFPLSIYTQGERVKQIQRTLNSRFNAGLSDDGYWGPKTQSALLRYGQATVFNNKTELSVFLGATNSTNAASTFSEMATSLAHAVRKRSSSSIMAVLAKMKTTGDYKALSDLFSQTRTPNAIGIFSRRTVVNALVGDDMPWTREQKIAHAKELLRMGLKYSASRDKWSLSGLGSTDRRRVYALGEAIVSNGYGRMDMAQPGEFLGLLVQEGGGVAIIQNDRLGRLYVPTRQIDIR